MFQDVVVAMVVFPLGQSSVVDGHFLKLYHPWLYCSLHTMDSVVCNQESWWYAIYATVFFFFPSYLHPLVWQAITTFVEMRISYLKIRSALSVSLESFKWIEEGKILLKLFYIYIYLYLCLYLYLYLYLYLKEIVHWKFFFHKGWTDSKCVYFVKTHIHSNHKKPNIIITNLVKLWS